MGMNFEVVTVGIGPLKVIKQLIRIISGFSDL